MNKEEITVFIADDHEILRFGLKQILNLDNNITVIGEAKDGLEALNSIKQLCPDVVLLDIIMPEMNGLDVAFEIKKCLPLTKIILFTALDDVLQIKKAISINVDGYLVKNGEMNELIESIYDVCHGKKVYSKSVLMLLQNGLIDFEKDEFNPITITQREEEILHLISEGKNNSTIAEMLSISIRTVERHRSNIIIKMELKSKTDLMHFALKNY